MLTNSDKKITVEGVQAEINTLTAEFRLRKRRLTALLAVLKAEAAGQRLLPGIGGGTAADGAKEKP